MISYNWGSKTTMLKVRDRLQAAGFKVWMDVDDMSTLSLKYLFVFLFTFGSVGLSKYQQYNVIALTRITWIETSSKMGQTEDYLHIAAGSTLEAMAKAVEKASLVIICMTQKYKESPSCRTGKNSWKL